MKKNSIFTLILILIILLGGLHIFKANTQPKTLFTFVDLKTNLFKPFKIKDQALKVKAKIASSTLIKEDQKIILYKKNLEKESAIASITKLMTAVIAIEKYPADSKIEVNDKILETWGTSGKLVSGEHFTVKNLLYIMLIESSNDAAECLASKLGKSNFLLLMNEKAKELKMKNTFFVNPTGLDEDNGSFNTSSAKDLTILTTEIIEKYPLIKEILSKTSYSVISEEGIEHKLRNTNILLKEIPYKTWGKTGYTEKANECLILMTKSPHNDIIINIIINSNDRFKEMKTLTSWVENNFSF